MKLSEMRQLLTEHDLRLTKSLGQNFLHDGNQLRRIVEAAQLALTDKVLEIGPGLGPLTELLLDRAGEVLAIEKDGRLVEILRKRFADQPKLTLLHADALDHLQQEPRDWTGWKLVANLPYSVASPILVELAQPGRCPQMLVATLQLEVARRIMAKPGSDDYGLLTLLLQLHYEPAGLFKIPASCFFPPPDVDSACITLVRRVRPLLEPSLVPLFVKLVKLSFSQRRKQMVKLLKRDWPEAQVLAACKELGLAADLRAEAVSLEKFAALSQSLAEH